MAASPEIQLLDKSTLLQPTSPCEKKTPNGVLQPVTSGKDGWFIQYMLETEGRLSLSVATNGVMWDNRQAFGRGETRHPSFGPHKMATTWIDYPAAVWSRACSERCVFSCMWSLTHIAGWHFKLTHSQCAKANSTPGCEEKAMVTHTAGLRLNGVLGDLPPIKANIDQKRRSLINQRADAINIWVNGVLERQSMCSVVSPAQSGGLRA